MCKNPADRLGVGDEGYAQLTTHPWFRDIDWKQIEEQTAEPPFSPDVSIGTLQPRKLTFQFQY